jgi:multiple sugar transport system substrate-binding protein
MKILKLIQMSVLTVCILVLILGISCSPQQNSKIVTITSASWAATPTEAQLIHSLVAEFEKRHPNIKVKYDIITRDYGSKILTQLAGGNAPESFGQVGIYSTSYQ